jgi:hypothetical protein
MSLALVYMLRSKDPDGGWFVTSANVPVGSAAVHGITFTVIPILRCHPSGSGLEPDGPTAMTTFNMQF